MSEMEPTIPYEPGYVVVDFVKLWRQAAPATPICMSSGSVVEFANSPHGGIVFGEAYVSPHKGRSLVCNRGTFPLTELSPMLRGSGWALEYTCDEQHPEKPGGSVLRFRCNERDPIANNHETD